MKVTRVIRMVGNKISSHTLKKHSLSLCTAFYGRVQLEKLLSVWRIGFCVATILQVNGAACGRTMREFKRRSFWKKLVSDLISYLNSSPAVPVTV